MPSIGAIVQTTLIVAGSLSLTKVAFAAGTSTKELSTNGIWTYERRFRHGL